MIKSKITREHVQVHTITEYEHFPEHNERKETREFRNAKHELENIEHLPCYVCHTRNKLESHHLFERSEWNGLDVRQVAFFLFNHFDFHGHVHRDFKSAEDLHEWFMTHFNGKVETVTLPVYDEEDRETGETQTVEVHTCDDVSADTLYNQLILCKNNHRGMSTGIHGCTAPTFFAWLARRAGFKPSLTKAEYEAQKGVSA